MRATRKWQQIDHAHACDVVRTAPSIAEAARRLGISRDTLHAWLKKGLVPRPASVRQARRQRDVEGPVVGTADLKKWARSIRRRYQLTDGESLLLDVLVEARTMAGDGTVPPALRLQAMREVRALIKQLNFEDPRDGEIEEADVAATSGATARRAADADRTPGPTLTTAWPRRSGGR